MTPIGKITRWAPNQITFEEFDGQGIQENFYLGEGEFPPALAGALVFFIGKFSDGILMVLGNPDNPSWFHSMSAESFPKEYVDDFVQRLCGG